MSPSCRAASTMLACSTHSSELSRLPRTGLDCLGALDLGSVLVAKECCMFSRCVHRSRFSSRLFEGFESLWLTNLCAGEGGSTLNASSITRCRANFFPPIPTCTYPLFFGVGAVTGSTRTCGCYSTPALWPRSRPRAPLLLRTQKRSHHKWRPSSSFSAPLGKRLRSLARLGVDSIVLVGRVVQKRCAEEGFAVLRGARFLFS